MIFEWEFSKSLAWLKNTLYFSSVSGHNVLKKQSERSVLAVKNNMLVLCLCTLWFFVFFPMKFIFWKLYDTRDWRWVFVLIDGIKRPIVMPWWRNKHCFFSKLVFHSPLTLAQKSRKMLKKGSQGWKLVFSFIYLFFIKHTGDTNFHYCKKNVPLESTWKGTGF